MDRVRRVVQRVVECDSVHSERARTGRSDRNVVRDPQRIGDSGQHGAADVSPAHRDPLESGRFRYRNDRVRKSLARERQHQRRPRHPDERRCDCGGYNASERDLGRRCERRLLRGLEKSRRRRVHIRRHSEQCGVPRHGRRRGEDLSLSRAPSTAASCRHSATSIRRQRSCSPTILSSPKPRS